MEAEEIGKAILAGNIGEMEGSEGWERIPDFCAKAGDIQAKPTRVSGGFDFLVFFQEPFEVFS